MKNNIRIGLYSFIEEVFWVQVAEAVKQNALIPHVTLIELDIQSFQATSHYDPFFIEDIAAQDLDALISADLNPENVIALINQGIPVINLSESSIRHPLYCSPTGLFETAREIGGFIAEQLQGRGNLLLVGGTGGNNDNTSRLRGFKSIFQQYPEIHYQHFPSLWNFDDSFPQIYAQFQNLQFQPDAIIGLSDTLALTARNAANSLGLLRPGTLIGGINGDPLALVAILKGDMLATVETSAFHHGKQAVELALQAAHGGPLPEHFHYHRRLITRSNIAEAASEKLVSLAGYPNRLVGENRLRQVERISQMEAILQILQKAEQILDPQEMRAQIPLLIEEHLGYSCVRFYLRGEGNHLETDHELSAASQTIIQEVIHRDKPIFVPMAGKNAIFAADPDFPATFSRVVIPVHLGRKVIGIIDAHSEQYKNHLPDTLIELQLLVDQLGTIFRNVELYAEVKKSREEAVKTHQVKTSSIATISHELRTPLDIILGTTRELMQLPECKDNPYISLKTIYQNADHLKRIANDLFDLSRAEINQLVLNLEICDIRPVILDAFESISTSSPAAEELQFQLHLPEKLPLIKADPVRLKQILLNLLHNAMKYTHAGMVSLEVEAGISEIHIQVKDTGPGIPDEIKDRIFEPFVTARPSDQDREGTGLGLTITRSLVHLHQGKILAESEVGKGSTFHVYLPVPAPGSRPVEISNPMPRTLLVISTKEQVAPEITRIALSQGLEIRRVACVADVEALLAAAYKPSAVAWNASNAGLEEWLVINKIHQSPRLNRLPFILLSDEIVPSQTAAVTGVMMKPVSDQNLFDQIDTFRSSIRHGPILIVDDDPRVCQLYSHLVRRKLPGFEVYTAHSGKMAIQKVKEKTPSLVILDLMMPGMDGFDLLDWIRSNEETKTIPVVIISGRALTRDDVVKIGRHAHVTFNAKGILSEEEMADTLRKALEGKGALPPSTSMWVKLVLAYIHQNYVQPLSRQEIAQHVGITESYLTRIFHAELGLTPWEYLTRYRIERSRQLLASTNDSILYIANRVGFSDPAYFSRVFRKITGKSPKAYRRYKN